MPWSGGGSGGGGGSSPVRPSRYITGAETLTADDRLITADGSSVAVPLTLYGSPSNGQMVEIIAVDLTNAVTIIGTVNGVAGPHSILNEFEAFKFSYDSTLGYWLAR